MKIADRMWFENALIEAGFNSVANLAEAMKIGHRSTLNRRFAGTTDITYDECIQLARLLNKTLDEVLEHTDAPPAPRKMWHVSVIGAATLGDGRIDTRRKTQRKAPVSLEVPDTIAGVDITDVGWVAIYQPASCFEPAAVDRFAVVESEDQKILGVLRRDKAANGWTVFSVCGGEKSTWRVPVGHIRRAAPVLWVRT